MTLFTRFSTVAKPAFTSTCLAAVLAIAGAGNTFAASFTAGNLVAVLATPTGTVSNASVVMQEFTSAGSTSGLQAVTIPSTGSNALHISASAGTSCYISLSADQTLVTLPGANSSNTTSNENGLSPRAIGTLNSATTFNIATTYTGTSGMQERSATTMDDSNFYISDQGGLYTNGSGATGSNSTNLLSIRSFGGYVYVCSANFSGSPVEVVPSPTATAFTSLSGVASDSKAVDFYMISSGNNGTAYDILYMLSSTNGLKKYSLVSGSWVANGADTNSTVEKGFGMAAASNGSGGVVFYMSTNSGNPGNSIVTFTDQAGYNTTINDTTPSTLLTASGTTYYKSVAFAPLPVTISTTGTLSALSTTQGTASSPTSFSISAVSLTHNITLTAPAGFEISTSSGSGYSSSLTLTESGGSVASTTIYVRLAASTSAGTYSGPVSCVSSGVPTIYVPTASSTVGTPNPAIAVTGTATPVSTVSGTASTPTTFSASGSNLTGNITVTAPSGFEISTSVGSGYSSSLTLTESSGSVASTPIYVRLTSMASTGSHSGNVTLSSSGATSVNEAIPASTVVTSFTQGNLAVEQFDGNGSSSSAPFAIIELSPSSASQSSPVNTYNVPAAVTSSALRQTSDGSSGRLALSNDGTLLAFTGYEDATGVADETTIALRGAASLTSGFSYALQASYTSTTASGDQTRSATFNGGTWYMADKSGVYLNGATAAANATNIRPVKSFGGTVYALSDKTTAVLSTLSADGTTLTGLTGIPADANANDFYMISSGVNGSTFDIAYWCDGATVTKYSLVGGTWTANGSATAIGVTGDGFCAAGNGTGANLYVSTGTVSNSVVKITDTAGYNQAPSINTSNDVTLYTVSSGFPKGVAFAPTATALPDLTIATSSPENSASASFAYTVTVANSGAASASGVNAQLTLPTGLTFVSGTDNGSDGFTVSGSSGVVSINGGTLAAGASDTITVQVTGSGGGSYTVDAGTSAGTVGHGFSVINTSATTTTPLAESNSANNCDNVSDTTNIASPVITATGSLSAVSTSYGVPSSPTSFSVSGSNLSGNITVAAPSGFEVSTSSSSGYASMISLAQSSGSVSATTVYVRLAASTADGTYSGNVALSSPSATTVNEPVPSSTVNPSAYLTSLTSSVGGLNKQFAPLAMSYTQFVNSSVLSSTITTAQDSGATVTVNGQPASTPVSLNTGINTVTIVVTNGGLTQTYTITIVRAGAFTPGDLVVTTYGNIAVAPIHADNAPTLITLQEFPATIAANSTPVMAFTLPSAPSGNDAGICGEFGSSSEGALQQTADGLYLTIGGYSAGPGLAYTAGALAQSPCMTVPRVAAIIDGNTNADTTSVFNDIYNTNNARCVYSPDDFNLYLSGQGAGTGDEGGIYYTQDGTNTTSGGSMPTGIFNQVSTRNLVGFGGNLYYSADQNSSKGIQTGLFEYSGFPTASEGTNTGTTIVPANNGGSINYSPEGFWFANATTLYVADTGDPKAGGTSDGGIQKWVYNGSAWVLKYTVTSPNFLPSSQTATAASGETGLEALTGTVTNGVASLYAVSYTAGDADANGLYGVTDTLTSTSSSATLTEIAAAPGIQASGTNPDYVFKGVSFAPTGSPVNSVPASNITSAGATLNGSLNPEGTDTVAYFNYGTTNSLGSTTSSQDLGSGDSAVPFGIGLSGLQPGTTYYYQLVTVANGLTSTYAIQSFTTAAAQNNTANNSVDTPAMPPAALILMALALVGVSAALLKRQQGVV
jgi:hypothetical protein